MALVELALTNSGYGGDVILSATGDLVLVTDTPGNPAASLQLLTRIVLTNPIGVDAAGNYDSRSDDLFNINSGSGARALIGEPLTPSLQYALQNRIAAAIVAHPNFVQSPAPTIAVFTNGSGDGSLFVSLSATTITGDVATVPNLPLANF